MIISSQRTLYALDLQNSLLSGDIYTPKPNTTLNEKYSHLVNEPIGSDTNYSIKYLAIGTSTAPPANTAGYVYSNHSSLDAALYNQVPFVVRPIDNDITPTEQAKYRFRIIQTVAGVQYYTYYLKAIPLTDINRNLYNITKSNNTPQARLSIIDFNTSSHLTPTPLSGNRTYGVNNQFATAAMKIKFQLTPAELAEITAGVAMLHGPLASNVITEMAVCGGLDKTVNGILEAINTQIYFHVSVNIDLQLTYDPIAGYLRAIELGGTEPIYV